MLMNKNQEQNPVVLFGHIFIFDEVSNYSIAMYEKIQITVLTCIVLLTVLAN